MTKIKEKAFWIAAGDVAGRGLSFITSIYLARTLGSEFFGLITVAISILGYATWFSDLGLISIGTRETAKEPAKRIYRVKEIFQVKIILGILVLILATFVISTIDMGEIEKQVILGYMYSIIPYMALMEWFYAGKQEFGKIAVSKVFNGLVYFLLVVLLVHNMEDVTLVPVLYTVGVSVAAISLGTFAIKDKPFVLPSRGLQIFSDLLKTSSIVGLGKFFAQLVHLLPPLIIGSILTLHDAGQYGAAFRIVIIAMMIDRIFVNLLLPNLASIWATDKYAAIKRVETVYKLVTAGGVAIALFFALSAEPIVYILYGAEYYESIPMLQILSVLIAVTFVNSLFSFGLIATNNDKQYFLATCFGGTISAIVIIAFAAFGSTIQVVIGVSLAEIIITLFTYFWFQKVVPINYLKPLLLSYPAAILLFVIFYFVPFPDIINTLLAVTFYAAYLFMIKFLSSSEYFWVKDKLIK